MWACACVACVFCGCVCSGTTGRPSAPVQSAQKAGSARWHRGAASLTAHVSALCQGAYYGTASGYVEAILSASPILCASYTSVVRVDGSCQGAAAVFV